MPSQRSTSSQGYRWDFRMPDLLTWDDKPVVHLSAPENSRINVPEMGHCIADALNLVQDREIAKVNKMAQQKARMAFPVGGDPPVLKLGGEMRVIELGDDGKAKVDDDES